MRNFIGKVTNRALAAENAHKTCCKKVQRRSMEKVAARRTRVIAQKLCANNIG
jgi:hypothetical protein